MVIMCWYNYNLLQFFLELLYFSKGSHSEGGRGSLAEGGRGSLAEVGFGEPHFPVSVESLQHLRRADADFKTVEGSVFSTAASAFSHLVDDMRDRMVAQIVEDAKVACYKYQTEKCVYSDVVMSTEGCLVVLQCSMVHVVVL